MDSNVPEKIAVKSETAIEVLGNFRISGIINCHQHIASKNHKIQNGISNEKVLFSPIKCTSMK